MFHKYAYRQVGEVFEVFGWYDISGVMNWYQAVAAFRWEQTAKECTQAFNNAAQSRDSELYAQAWCQYRLAMIPNYFDD